VTVAVPTVTRISYLREAIQSLAAQTFPDFEVVIGDNSARAEYAGQVDAVVAGFPRLDIRAYHHASDLGMVGNAQFLVDVARGEYWIYLPDDDRHVPECLATLVAALDGEPRAGVAFSDHVIIDAQGRVDSAASEMNSRRYGREGLRSGFYPRDQLFELALAQVFELQSMLFRMPVIRALGFRKEAGPVPDFDLQLRLWQAPMQGAVYCAARLNEYRIHAGQATGEKNPRAANAAIIQAIERAAPEGAMKRKSCRVRLSGAYSSLALLDARDGNRVSARKYASQALTLTPFSFRSLAIAGLSILPPAWVRAARSTFRWLSRL
ncbi:MAG: glycosyltransferase family 2 protein, partial [Betaproteobacteria bacterium]